MFKYTLSDGKKYFKIGLILLLTGLLLGLAMLLPCILLYQAAIAVVVVTVLVVGALVIIGAIFTGYGYSVYKVERLSPREVKEPKQTKK